MHECVIVAIPLLKSQLYVPGLWILCHMLSNEIDVNLRAKKRRAFLKLPQFCSGLDLVIRLEVS